MAEENKNKKMVAAIRILSPTARVPLRGHPNGETPSPHNPTTHGEAKMNAKQIGVTIQNATRYKGFYGGEVVVKSMELFFDLENGRWNWEVRGMDGNVYYNCAESCDPSFSSEAAAKAGLARRLLGHRDSHKPQPTEVNQ